MNDNTPESTLTELADARENGAIVWAKKPYLGRILGVLYFWSFRETIEAVISWHTGLKWTPQEEFERKTQLMQRETAKDVDTIIPKAANDDAPLTSKKAA